VATDERRQLGVLAGHDCQRSRDAGEVQPDWPWALQVASRETLPRSSCAQEPQQPPLLLL
jgi:hypothetical protein